MKQKITLITTMLLLSIVTWATTNVTLNIADGNITLQEASGNLEYQQGTDSWTTYTGELTITGDKDTPTTNTITVQSGTHNVTIQNVNIDVSQTGGCAFDIKGTATVTLTLAGENTLSSGNYQAALQVFYNESEDANASVSIQGDGKLTATGGLLAAGIGGRIGTSAGNITITGGTIVAQGGLAAAGIGGGNWSKANITISGGRVTAIGGNYPPNQAQRSGGAGIGGGSGVVGGKVTITGTANVTAQGGTNSAGIGGGDGSNAGTITISGTAKVAATGGTGGAGIGEGYQILGHTITTITAITISENANVTAQGGTLGAGIGGGRKGGGGTITISGGTVVATGGEDGAGIGTGYDAGSNPDATPSIILIENNANVTAIGGTSSQGGGAAIGGGTFTPGGTITINGGTVTATSHEYSAAIGGGFSAAGGNITINGGTVMATNTELGVAIGGGSNTAGATISISDAATVIAVARQRAYDLYALRGTVTGTATMVMLSFEKRGAENTETVISNGTNTYRYTPTIEYKSIAVSNIEPGTYTVTADNFEQNGIKSTDTERSTNFVVTKGLNTFIEVKNLYPHNPTFNIADNNITLREETSVLQYRQGRSGDWTTYTGELTITGDKENPTQNTITVWSGTHNITLSNVNIDVSGVNDATAFDIGSNATVNLTLADNTTNTLKSGSGKAGLQVQAYLEQTATVEIKGSGTLTAQGGAFSAGIGSENEYDGGIIKISSTATVTAIGGNQAAGIGGGNRGDGGTITISDNAQVTATGGERGGAGIGGGSSASGGTTTISDNARVTATGRGGGAGIGGGYLSTGGTISISGTVTVTAIGASGIGNGNYFEGNSASTIAIGSTAIVTAVSDGARPAIDDTDGTITAPAGEVVANILLLNYEAEVAANTATSVTDATNTYEYTPTAAYQSIAFTLANTGDYTIKKAETQQQAKNSSSVEVNTLTVSAGLNIFTEVKDNTIRTITAAVAEGQAAMGYVSVEDEFGAAATAFAEGDIAYFVASVNEGFEFVNWTNADGAEVSTSISYEYTVGTVDYALTANYKVATYTIIAALAAGQEAMGTAVVEDDFGSEKTLFEEGDMAYFTATPSIGYEFVNWTDAEGGVVSTDAIYTYTVGAVDYTLTANFKASAATGVTNPTAQNIVTYAQGDYVVIKGATMGDAVTIYSTSGAILYRGSITSTLQQIPLQATGVFVVRVGDVVTKVVK